MISRLFYIGHTADQPEPGVAACREAINANLFLTGTQQNVSQWVNSARIEAACTLLKSRDLTVTQAMLEAGFSTKSNFNREFKRVTGYSPSEWRAQL